MKHPSILYTHLGAMALTVSGMILSSPIVLLIGLGMIGITDILLVIYER